MSATTMPGSHDSELERLRAENARLVAEHREAVGARDAAVAERDSALEVKAKLERKLSKLELTVDELLRKLFGRSSEKVDPQQILLDFAAAEPDPADEIPTPPHAAEAPDGETQDVPARPTKKRKGHGWSKLPKNLPRKRVEIMPAEDERECDRCGKQRVSIGSPEISERLDYKPASLFVVETVRHRLRCPDCQDGTVVASLPPAPIEAARGRAEAGLLAHIVVSKYADHLPLHRLEGILSREGAQLSRSTLCDWVHGTADLLRVISEEVLREVLARPVVGLDETGIRVIFDKNDRKNGTRNARIWVYRGLPGELYYAISETKAKADAAGPMTVLADYVGFVQADAASVFDDIYADGTRVEVGCNAHARRKFFDAKASNPREAAYVLATYRKVYEIEARVREASPATRLRARQKETKPLLTAFDKWLDQVAASPGLVPGTPLATAVGYSRNHRAALRRFLDDPRLSPDNNAVERALRLVAVGRKNWLFAGSEQAARDAATLYTLVGSCRELEIDPWDYLRDVIERRAAGEKPAMLTPRAWKDARPPPS